VGVNYHNIDCKHEGEATLSWGGGRKGGVTLLGQALNSNRWARHSGKSENTGVIEKVGRL
jgi:hypothetical protein